MTDDGPIKAFVMAYDRGDSYQDLVVPAAALREAERELDAERERRRRVAEEARIEAEAAARVRTWRGRLGALWRRWNP